MFKQGVGVGLTRLMEGTFKLSSIYEDGSFSPATREMTWRDNGSRETSEKGIVEL